MEITLGTLEKSGQQFMQLIELAEKNHVACFECLFVFQRFMAEKSELLKAQLEKKINALNEITVQQ